MTMKYEDVRCRVCGGEVGGVGMLGYEVVWRIWGSGGGGAGSGGVDVWGLGSGGGCCRFNRRNKGQI